MSGVDVAETFGGASSSVQENGICSPVRMVCTGRIWQPLHDFSCAYLWYLGCMDGVDMKFEACVVVNIFPPGILRSYHASTSVDRTIPVKPGLTSVVSFELPDAAPTPLPDFVDTGSGMFVLTFSAFNSVAVHVESLSHWPVRCQQQNLQNLCMAERVLFQLGGVVLETNFLLGNEPMGVEDFLVGGNFLRSYQVLVDLTSMQLFCEHQWEILGITPTPSYVIPT